MADCVSESPWYPVGMSLKKIKSGEVKRARKWLISRQNFFQHAVRVADMEWFFPENPLDIERELDHHSMAMLQLFAEEVIENHLPDEFERQAECPVCCYKKVGDLNRSHLLDGHDAKTLSSMHPFDFLAVKKHLEICIPRVAKVAVGTIASPTEIRQARTILDRINELDGEAKEIQLAARYEGDFKAAVDSVKTRMDILGTVGRITGEIPDPKAAHPQVSTKTEINVISLSPTQSFQYAQDGVGGPMRLNQLPAAEDEVTDVEFEESE